MNVTRFLRHQTATLLLLTVSLAEIIPAVHDHGGSHACAQLDGSYYFIEPAAHDEHAHEEVTVSGMRLGESHEHPACALCHLSSQMLVSKARTLALFVESVPYPVAELQTLRQRDQRQPKNRGPPRRS